MKEFVYGTDYQYDLLKDMLEDHLCHVYKDCEYPSCLSRPSGRIGFEKERDTYAVFIDQGMTCTGSNIPRLFSEWVRTGTLRFLDFNDLKEFMRGLKSLY